MDKILFVGLFVMLMAWIYYIYFRTIEGTHKNKDVSKPLGCGNQEETESSGSESESFQ
jgi:hypothetical protein